MTGAAARTDSPLLNQSGDVYRPRMKELFTPTPLVLRLAISISLGVLAGSAAGAKASLQVTELRTEGRLNPLGIDRPEPRLSWKLTSAQRGQKQTAYQVRVGTDATKLARNAGIWWDSGRVASSESVNVIYNGPGLQPAQRVWWTVRVWDKDGRASAWSQPAWWEMGLLAPADWQATWNTRDRRPHPGEAEFFQDAPAPLFRKEFRCDQKVRRARVYVSGLGYYELTLNGRRVGDQVLDPGWTSYAHRILYSTYDVTEQLQRGANVLGIMLGNGWFNPAPLRLWGKINLREHLTTGAPQFILQLRVEFEDGSTQTIVSDETWQVADGPVRRNNLYLGEVYDARQEQPGWNQPDFAAGHWASAVRAESPQRGALRAQSAPPIRITRTLKPVRLTEPRPGVFIFDLGQNFAGWARLHVNGPAGTRVRLRYGELLYPDGTLNGMTAVCGQIKSGGPDYRYDGDGPPRTAFQQDEYILRGAGRETFTPRFTFHGFRYVEVTGFPGRPDLATLEGLRLNSDVESAGTFACSNEQFNRIQEMVLWTELSNLFSVQSDCPHREKFGYGGDIVASSEMALLNFNMHNFYAKAVEDLADAVRPNGGFTETAPFVGISDEGLGDQAGPVGWGTAHPLLLTQLHQYYGDRRLLEEQYAWVRNWLQLLRTQAREGILDNGISDHESLAPKPRALTGTAFYYFNAQLLAHIARTLGRTTDAAEAEVLAEQIKAAFNRKFLQAGTGRYDTGTQACQAFALYFGLVPGAEQTAALHTLIRDIEQAHQGHLSTGIFGTKYLLHTLADHDRAEVAYRVVDQRTFPGWGFMLANGATTLWEHWEFSDNTYSHNHPMFGSVSEWFYKVLAGIQPAREAVGFDRILIKPQPVGDLQWVKASYDSVRGHVTSDWQKRDHEFQLRISIPVGASATVFVPARDVSSLREGGRPLTKTTGVRLVRMAAGTAELAVESGDYRFTASAE